MQGDATQQLKNIKIIDYNYKVVWKHFVSKYRNQLDQFSTHYETFGSRRQIGSSTTKS